MSSDDDFMSGPLNKTKTGAVAPKAVLPWLFIGNDKTPTEKKFLSNINHIIDIDGTLQYKGDISNESFKPVRGILSSQFGEDDDDDEEEEEEESEAEESEEEEEDAGALFQKLLIAIYKSLKKQKDDKKTVLIVSKKPYYAAAIVVSYMLRSTKALDKYLSLKQALEFVKAKDINFAPNGQLLLHLVVLEEQLFDEVSVKLPSNSRGKGGGSFKQKPSGNKSKGRK